MRSGIIRKTGRSKRGITLTELIVAMTLTSIFAVICIALINPISNLYQKTVKLSRAQLLADSIVDGIRKECDGIKFDDKNSVWIANFDEGKDDELDLLTEGPKVLRASNTTGGNALIIQKNNNYAESIYSCVAISNNNLSKVTDLDAGGKTTGHAVEALFKAGTDNLEKGKVHFGYYKAKENDDGIFPFQAYDYTNPVLASTYGKYTVELKFTNLTFKEYKNDEGAVTRKYPSYVECQIKVYDGDYFDADVAFNGPIYTRSTVISFSANGSGVGTGRGHIAPDKNVDVDVKVIFVNEKNEPISWPVASVNVSLYVNNGLHSQISFSESRSRLKVSDVASDGNVTIDSDEVSGYMVERSGKASTGFTVKYTLVSTSGVKLISGPSFRNELLNKGVISVVFGKYSDHSSQVAGVTPTNVAIDIKAANDNQRKPDYQLYLVDAGNDKNNAYILSADGNFVFNENCTSMFEDCTEIVHFTLDGITNDNTSKIDTSRTKTMLKMFRNCQRIEQFNLPGFVTSTTTNLSYMFEKCFMCYYCNFDGWNTSRVTTMNKMFQNFHGKYTRNGSTFDPQEMAVLDVSMFDFSQCTDMEKMFGWNDPQDNPKIEATDPKARPTGRNLKKIILPTGSKNNTSKVKNMNGMFSWCLGLEEIENLDKLDFDSVTTFEEMFSHCEVFKNFNINVKDCPNLTNSVRMFSYCKALESYDVSDWNWPNLTTAQYMFSGCSNLKTFTGNGFKIPSCSTLTGFFNECSELANVSLNEWDIRSLPTLLGFFEGREKLKKVSLNDCVTCVGETGVASIESMFNQCTNLQELYMRGFVGKSCTSIKAAFKGCKSIKKDKFDISEWKTSNVKNMSYAFCQFHTDRNEKMKLNVRSLEFNSVTDMSFMFSESGLAGVDFPARDDNSQLSFPKVTTFKSMFNNCLGMTEIDISGWNCPELTSVEDMFKDCSSMQTLTGNGFKMPKCSSLKGFVSGCSALQNVWLNEWDISSITTMEEFFKGNNTIELVFLNDCTTTKLSKVDSMFYQCANLQNVYMKGFIGEACTSMVSMFRECKKINGLNLSDWETKNVINMNYAFYQVHTTTTDNFEIDISDFHFDSVETMDFMFSGSGVVNVIFPERSVESPVLVFSKLKSMESLFQACKGLTTVTNFENISIPYSAGTIKPVNNLFAECSSLESIKICFDIPYMWQFRKTFYNCPKLKNIDISGSNLPKCTSLSMTCDSCTALEKITMNDVILSSFTSYNANNDKFLNNTPKLKTIEARGITTKNISCFMVKTVETMDLSGANLTSYSNFTNLFSSNNNSNVYCPELKTINMSGIKTADTVSCFALFKNLAKLETADVSGWVNSSNNPTKFAEIRDMFNGCVKVKTIDFSGLDFSQVTNPGYMFRTCSSLERIYVSAGTDLSDRFASTTMFSFCSSNLVGGRGTTWTEGNTSGLYACVDDPDNRKPGYFSVK